MKKLEYSAVIIGSGIAGLYAAIKLAESNRLNNKILLVTKSRLKESNSRYAQGGIVGVLPENTQDSVSLHVNDTLKAGAGLSDNQVAIQISQNSSEIINDLIKKGVQFDKNDNSGIALTLEGAHSVKRILHAGGDSTGKHIEVALAQRVEENSQIDIACQTQAVDLLLGEDNVCRGVVIFDTQQHEYSAVFANSVIIATGGLGQIYSNTTNPSIATGDGIALAYKADAVLQDMEFVQFHPTALALKDDETRFLISESVRGEGARLKNQQGEYFTNKYDKRGELAPRDIVTRSIYFEMKETNTDCVYLDTSDMSEELIRRRFPNISKVCLEKGIDIVKDPIPVSPAAHYSMGGIKITVDGKTNIEGLYATGEASCTSFHGANRLASNSLLECAVSSSELAKRYDKDASLIDYSDDSRISETIAVYDKSASVVNDNLEILVKRMRDTMWQNAGIVRTEQSLNKALQDLYEIRNEFGKESKCATLREYEFRNMLILSEVVVKCALARRESRGAHYRADFPAQSCTAYHSYIKKGELLKNNAVSFT